MVRRIAVLRALFLGDLICAEPALRALKARYPLAELTFIGLPWSEPFLQRYAYIDRFLAFPGCPGIREVAYDPAATAAFLTEAQHERYDLAVQMHGSGPESNDFVGGLGARVSLGFTPDGHSPSLTRCVRYPGDTVHEVRKWLSLAAHVGASAAAQPQLPILPDEYAEATALLAGLDPAQALVALHATSRDPARRWPVERFAALADRLWLEHACQVVLVGAAENASTHARLAQLTRAPIRDLCGRTSVGSLAAVLERARLLVTNDSGPSHVAAARGVRSVVLFGPTDPARWAPLDATRHRVVRSPTRDLQHLELDQVWPAVDKMLQTQAAARGCP
jgi:ADP-heptose:LPS heptosyltransferase